MALPDAQLRQAIDWRAKQISRFQRIIEVSRHSEEINSDERRRLLQFAADEIHKLNVATNEEMIKYFKAQAFVIDEIAEGAVESKEDEVVD